MHTTNTNFINQDEKLKYKNISLEYIFNIFNIELDSSGKPSCPSCGSGSRNNRTSALFFRNNNTVFCNVCKFNADTIALVSKINNYNFIETINWFRNFDGSFVSNAIKNKNYKIVIKKENRIIKNNINIYNIAKKNFDKDVKEYLKSRYIIIDKVQSTVWNLKPFHFFYEKGFKLIIPEIRNGKTIFYKMRNIHNTENKILNGKNLSKCLFGIGNLKNNVKKTVIVEGEIDYLIALSYLNVDKINIIAVPDAGYVLNDQEVELLKNKEIFILLDNDKYGQKGSIQINNLLKKSKIINYPKGVNDAADIARIYKGNALLINLILNSLFV